MEEEHAVSRPQGIPRLSRLPRTTNTAFVGQQADGPRLSRLPKPSNVSLAKPRATDVSGIDNDGNNSRFGWHSPKKVQKDTQAPSASLPSRNASDEAMVSVLERTSHVDETDEAFQGKMTTQEEISGQKLRRARPSLSERTMETMASIPPSPSPSRRKSSITTSILAMPPPSLPALLDGQRSPQSQLTRPASHASLGRAIPHASKLTSRDAEPESIWTPSRTLGARPGGVNQPVQKHTLGVVSPMGQDRSATPQRVKSVIDLKTSAKKQPVRKVSLNFKDVASSTRETYAHSTSLKRPSYTNLRSPARHEDTSSKLRKRPSFFSASESIQTDAPTKIERLSSGLKSSATLRDTIAKAKAAKRQVSSNLDSTSASNLHSLENGTLPMASDDALSGIFPGTSLKRRIQNAVSSGTLNIAAAGLKEVPPDVLQMYDYGENGNQAWSEAVDLTKFIIADNDIEVLSETVFPDWTIEELQEDEEKSNIFGGVEMLDFRGNRISSLPIGLRRLERLHTLNVSNNKLTMAAFEVLCQLVNLRDLSLANNNLSGTLPASFSGLSCLHTLNLQGNKLTDVGTNLSAIKNLRRLDVSSNLLTSLNVADFAELSLTELKAANNKLSGRFLPPNFTMSSLVSLNLSNNSLNTFSEGLVELTQLQSLVLDNNQLQSLGDLSNLQNLVTLTASENRLQDLPDGFVALQQLRTANFESNNIRLLDPYISKMDNLAILNVASNPLKDRKYLTMDTATLKEELAKRLTAVLIRDDGSSTPVPGSNASEPMQDSRLKSEKGVLDLSQGDLSAVDSNTIHISESIHTLKLSENIARTFPVNLLLHQKVADSLQTLNMAFTKALEPTSYLSSLIILPNLRVLNISNSKLASLDALIEFLQAPQLSELNVSCNRLSGPFPQLRKHFSHLTTLLAADNEYTSIAPDAIRGMEVVDIRNNSIEFLPPKIGELGNVGEQRRPGRLRSFECAGNKFRVPRLAVVEKGTESILQDLRRMVITDELGDEWKE